MSSFKCDKCGKVILEEEDGYYITECEHYPMSDLEKKRASFLIAKGGKEDE